MKRYQVSRYGFDYHLTVDDEVMERSYEQGELCEQGMLDWIVANVPKGGIWVDCGANIGEHSLVYATACGADKVIALEPVPANFWMLCDNARRTLGDAPGFIPARFGVGAVRKTMGIVSTAQGRNSQFALSGEGDVDVWPLDQLVNPESEVRLIKIDVEGMEVQVLHGARAILEKSKPELFIEIWKQSDLDFIRKWLGHFGYELIECYNGSPTFHFSASGRYPVTYTPRKLQ